MKTHGLTNSRIYHIWHAIKQRCTYEHAQMYRYYGGRGIKVCEEWFNNFEYFYTWAINNGYDDSLTIDRIDRNGNYEPNNCRWVNMTQQNINKGKQNNNTSGYIGIWLKTFKSGNKRWGVSLAINKKIQFLGYYDTQKEALEARNKYIIDNGLDYPIQEYKGEIGSLE